MISSLNEMNYLTLNLSTIRFKMYCLNLLLKLLLWAMMGFYLKSIKLKFSLYLNVNFNVLCSIVPEVIRYFSSSVFVSARNCVLIFHYLQ